MRVCSIDTSIRRSQSARKSSIAATYALPPARCHSASFAGVATMVPIRSPDATRTMFPSTSSKTWIGTLVVHAERERRRVHHLQAALDRLEVRQLRQEPGVRVEARIAVVDARDAVLRHQDRLGADLERPERRGGVGREERVAGACGEDHDPPLLEVADRAAPDVRLGDLGHGDRGLDPRLRAEPLERVLERQRVQERREHARVVGGRPVHPLGRGAHAAVEVPAADDDGDLRARRLDGKHLARDRRDGARVDAVLAVAHQALARELEEGPPERGSDPRGRLRELLGPRAHEPATETRANAATLAPASSSALPTVFEASWIHACSSRTPPGAAAKKRLASMPSTIFSRACSGFDSSSSELR